jgi:hypothetical protein
LNCGVCDGGRAEDSKRPTSRAVAAIQRVRDKVLPRCRWKSRSSHGEAAELRRHGSRANGSLNWAAWARIVLKGALIWSRPEDGRGKDSRPAPPERMVQMSAMKARVRQGVLGNVLDFHSDKDCRCGRESRSVGLVPCFHSMRVELRPRPGRGVRIRESGCQSHAPAPR